MLAGENSAKLSDNSLDASCSKPAQELARAHRIPGGTRKRSPRHAPSRRVLLAINLPLVLRRETGIRAGGQRKLPLAAQACVGKAARRSRSLSSRGRNALKSLRGRETNPGPSGHRSRWTVAQKERQTVSLSAEATGGGAAPLRNAPPWGCRGMGLAEN